MRETLISTSSLFCFTTFNFFLLLFSLSLPSQKIFSVQFIPFTNNAHTYFPPPPLPPPPTHAHTYIWRLVHVHYCIFSASTAAPTKFVVKYYLFIFYSTNILQQTWNLKFSALLYNKNKNFIGDNYQNNNKISKL